jgi:translocation and assembly module TamA
MRRSALHLRLFCMLVCAAISSTPAFALDDLKFDVVGDDSGLGDDLRVASLVVSALNEQRTEPRDILSAALADYGRLLETLYANGYYGGTINIRVDGREAASIPLLSVPTRISQIVISVDPGPVFRFGRAVIAPLAPQTTLPAGFETGKPARSVLIRDAVGAAVGRWRDVGHAKATPTGQRITADHNVRTLSAEVQIDPGPRVRFGNLKVTTPSAVRVDKIARIAGLPEGEVFSPETLARVTTRLRRTGAFTSVSMTEAETLGPDDSMDISLAVVDEKPRRFGFGAELSSLEGLDLSGFWLRRNLFGGAERLRIEANIGNIAGQTGGVDFQVGARIDVPARLGPDTKVFALTEFETLDELNFTSDQFSLGAGVTWYLSDRVEAQAGVTYVYSDTKDAISARSFSVLTFPTSVKWDNRDDPLDPTGGAFANVEATPFLGLSGSASGARLFVDGRGYRGLGQDDGVVLAGRVQVGSIIGAGITEVQPDYLFYSGGGGTVRGQPYQSLDVDLGGGRLVGGRTFVGLAFEARTTISGNFGAVAFVDAGYIGAESFFDGSGDWHSGAGVGLRYKTGIGPIRLDVAAPVSGTTGSGVQVYIGIGQAF